ncbi:hypothetical protein ACHAWF_008548 [Thalassiosira exigua]
MASCLLAMIMLAFTTRSAAFTALGTVAGCPRAFDSSLQLRISPRFDEACRPFSMTPLVGHSLPSIHATNRASSSFAGSFSLHALANNDGADESVQSELEPVGKATTDLKELASKIEPSRPRYQLGVGKNMPLSGSGPTRKVENEALPASAALNWHVPEPLMRKEKSQRRKQKYDTGLGKNAPLHTRPGQVNDRTDMRTTKHLLHKGDEESARLSKAVWDEGHFDDSGSTTATLSATPPSDISADKTSLSSNGTEAAAIPDSQQHSAIDYQQIDLSIPPSVYSLGSSSGVGPPVDLVWDLMRREAQKEAAREPLLVSFLHSTILNHPTLESALSFHLANRLSSPAMLSTQIMSLIREALDADPDFRRNLRADMLAVRDRDPACNCLPDVFLYFKGFHALQTYRVAHYMYRSGRRVLAHYLQSQVSQHFQIDIHPNATLGSGIMLDHGTGIVIGETAHLGHNCSVLHHVTLGGSGKKGVDRHPKVGNGVLLGAGASVLGNIKVGDGCQVGAGTLVIEDLPPRTVAVGVPAKIIGRFVDVTAQPSIGMNQLGSPEADEDIVMFGMDGI